MVPEPSSRPRTATSLGMGLRRRAGTKGTSKGDGCLFSPTVHTSWADPPAKLREGWEVAGKEKRGEEGLCQRWGSGSPSSV